MERRIVSTVISVLVGYNLISYFRTRPSILFRRDRLVSCWWSPWGLRGVVVRGQSDCRGYKVPLLWHVSGVLCCSRRLCRTMARSAILHKGQRFLCLQHLDSHGWEHTHAATSRVRWLYQGKWVVREGKKVPFRGAESSTVTWRHYFNKKALIWRITPRKSLVTHCLNLDGESK